MLRRPSREKGKPREAMRRFSAWIHSSSAKCALLMLLGGIALFGLFCAASAPKRYDLSVGVISNQTITATKDVEDTIATEKLRGAAADAVEPSYRSSHGVVETVLENLRNAFAELRTVQQYGQTLHAQDETTAEYKSKTFSDTELAYAQGLVKFFTLSKYQATTLLRTAAADFDVMVDTTTTAVESLLNSNIYEGQVTQAINTIKQIVGYRVETSLFHNVLPTVLNVCIKPNMIIDTEETEKARQAARDAVEPMMYLQGQNIIREGERVSLNQLEMLRALGLLENNSYDLSIYGGAAILTLIAMFLMVLLLRMFSPDALSNIRAMAVIMLVMIICEGISVLMVKLVDVYLAPLALCAMLLTVLLGGRVALAATFSMTLMIAGLTAASNTAYSTEMLHLLLTGVLGSIASIKFLRNKPQRVRMVVCGVVAAICNLVAMLSIGLMTSANFASILEKAAWSMGGGLISGILAIGLQPVFEVIFNLATPSKLMELSNPDQPLLRRLLIEAPGTYHHSIIVANLSEAAAEKIGANPLMARTGAYFHDVGKLKRPLYFKENQMGENPHDRTDPYVSAAIVTTHTRDGLMLAQKHRLPMEIQQIIVQHHGDTPVMYFYHKALQQADGKPVDISDFRYDGTRPSTKEAAIVMLADTIEAAVRSMPDPTPQAIERFIERLVRGKLEDGQLSNSPLTLKDIDGICEAFCTVLNGVFHERIEYPNMQPADAPKAAEPVKPAQEPAAAKPAAKPVEAPKPVEEPAESPKHAEQPEIKLEAPAEEKTPAEPSAPAEAEGEAKE